MSGGKVETNIQSIVNDLDIVSWKQVLNEAITNSLQANATNIKISFNHNTLDLNDTPKYIETITIEDNGDGFNDKNTKSFKEYKTPYKKDLGCKGIGRFFYLKVFEQVDIESLDKKIKFIINDDIKVEKIEDTVENTIFKFTKPKNNFTIDYKEYENYLREHFIAYFKLLKDKQISIDIEIYENDNFIFEIKSDDIPKFKHKEFKISKHTFSIDYILNDESIEMYNGFYCAGGRVVTKNSDLDIKKKFKFLNGVNILFLLSSEYFNNNVNETRDDFTIFPKRKHNDLFHNLSWNEIQVALKEQIKIIAKENDVDIEKLSTNSRLRALKEAPFLAYYLQNNDNNDDYETLKRNAEKMLREDKKFIRDNSDKIDDKYQEKLAVITQAELAEYIFDRQVIINKLKHLTTQKALEKELHNLFMKPKTKDENCNYRSNNLWLFDDRFMSYDKVFSDKQIKEIFPQLSENLDRPDILSIVSNTYEKEEITDIIIIELKKADEKITPARAEEQLIDYAGYINEAYVDRKIRIWTYAFLQFDEKTERSLNNKDYNRVLTKSKYPIYYKPFNKVNTIINFIDYYAIADDANSRNKTFMKILSGETINN